MLSARLPQVGFQEEAARESVCTEYGHEDGWCSALLGLMRLKIPQLLPSSRYDRPTISLVHTHSAHSHSYLLPSDPQVPRRHPHLQTHTRTEPLIHEARSPRLSFYPLREHTLTLKGSLFSRGLSFLTYKRRSHGMHRPKRARESL